MTSNPHQKNRRFFDRTRLQSKSDWIAAFIATAGGAGLLPIAPGTFGTAVGILILVFTNDAPLAIQCILWACLLATGVWAAGRIDRLMGTSDNQNIVIDEVLGVAVAALAFPLTSRTLIAAFIFFRVFDIVKPPPVRWIDQVTKRHPAWSAFGVIADDLAAGLQAMAAVLVIRAVGWL